MNLYEDLLARKVELQRAIRQAKKLTKNPVPEHLEARTQGNKNYYFIRTRDATTNERTRIYLPKEEIEKGKQIANYDYAKTILAKAERELRHINMLIADYDQGTPEQTYEKMCTARKDLIKPILIPESLYIEEWLSKRIQLTLKEDYPKPFLTDNQELVRSKSEKIIADKLKHEGIPYKYEEPLILDNKRFRIDFTILKVSTREEIYWEHFGLVDDIKYFDVMMSKLEIYERHGIYPHKNLIMTFESGRRPISVEVVNNIVSTLH